MPKENNQKTKVKSVRLPERIWDLIAKVSASEYRSTNEQILKLIEDYLVQRGEMKEADRKKSIRRKTS